MNILVVDDDVNITESLVLILGALLRKEGYSYVTVTGEISPEMFPEEIRDYENCVPASELIKMNVEDQNIVNPVINVDTLELNPVADPLPEPVKESGEIKKDKKMTVLFGEPIESSSLGSDKSDREWAAVIKKQVYQLAEDYAR